MTTKTAATVTPPRLSAQDDKKEHSKGDDEAHSSTLQLELSSVPGLKDVTWSMYRKDNMKIVGNFFGKGPYEIGEIFRLWDVKGDGNCGFYVVIRYCREINHPFGRLSIGEFRKKFYDYVQREYDSLLHDDEFTKVVRGFGDHLKAKQRLLDEFLRAIYNENDAAARRNYTAGCTGSAWFQSEMLFLVVRWLDIDGALVFNDFQGGDPVYYGKGRDNDSPGQDGRMGCWHTFGETNRSKRGIIQQLPPTLAELNPTTCQRKILYAIHVDNSHFMWLQPIIK